MTDRREPEPTRRAVEPEPVRTRHTEPERTPDGHHVVINGRRWRATDPEIPDEIATRLRGALMRARRDVGAALRNQDPVAERDARSRVHAAKVALGERGTPWWEQDIAERRQRWEDGLNALA
ncbi:hypothetical protein [Actinokineospora sp. NBRC 105648]|uniref:hypothetical protein n=1 Tax=Actinokineospora sp. NBRC 105648 TaxID=3032206 RepID=UPI0024A2AF83|nr:hypothetical protein [Actinokineospora sp. NBRC 105648]GLZ38010.1 hypothetical protein Acsp05_16340 [Actinokineospora sp. NBRC 105648]